jgi:hypothetical protein
MQPTAGRHFLCLAELLLIVEEIYCSDGFIRFVFSNEPCSWVNLNRQAGFLQRIIFAGVH